MKTNITYRNELLSDEIMKKVQVTELQPATYPVLKSLHNELKNVLENPINSKPFSALLQLKQPKTIAIAVPDDTSSVPIKDILPLLLEHIFKALPRIESSCVKIIVGSGLQSQPTIDNYHQALASAIAMGCDVSAHNSVTSEIMDLGKTHQGTPVRVNKTFAQAEFKICIGQMDPHHMAGFIGSSEEATIGCAAYETIETALGLSIGKTAGMGRIDGNPVRQDLDEIGRMIGLNFTINLVLNIDKKLIRVLAGLPESIFRQGAKICADVCGVKIEHKFDIVVASCGSDLKNNYHLEKTFNLIAQVIQKGGKSLLLTALHQSIGDDIYFDHVCHDADPDTTLAAVKEFEHQMGPRNAYLFGKASTDYNLQFDLNSTILNGCHLRAADPSTIIKEWVNNYEKKPELAIMRNSNIYIK